MVIAKTNSKPSHQKIQSNVSSSAVLFNKGQLPLIISAPHGGLNRPNDIPDRKRDGSLLLADMYTKEIAIQLSHLIEEYYGRKPYLIVNNVSRRKVDMNRYIEEGAETDKSRVIWKEYHDYLENSVDSILKHNKHGLLIDIHGHTHSHGMIELGYLLNGAEIKSTNADDLDDLILEKSSIQNLARRLQPLVKPTELLKREKSLSALISSRHLDVIPSPEHLEPVDESLYFFGGYITQKYHSNRDQKGLDAIQVEIPKQLRLETKSRDYFTKVLADSVIQILNAYYIPSSKL